MNEPSEHLHLVAAGEADLVELRARALRLFELRHVDPRSRATMLSALRRLARTFSNGRITHERDFPWEHLVEAADVLAIRAAAMGAYQRATVSRDLVALKQILHCCWKVGLLSYDEYNGLIDLPRLPPSGSSRAGVFLTVADLGAVLRTCREDPNPVKGLRDRAAIMTAAGSGVRRHELVGIQAAAIDLRGGFIALSTTKGGRPRTAYLPSPVCRTLALWAETRGEHRYAFPPVTRSGRIVADRALSAHQFWKMFRSRCAQAGLPATVTTHDLRRYTVSQLLSTTDLPLVARVVGHQSPSTTAAYDRRPDELCRDAVNTLPLPAWED